MTDENEVLKEILNELKKLNTKISNLENNSPELNTDILKENKKESENKDFTNTIMPLKTENYKNKECNNCNKPILGGEKFCTDCGQPVGTININEDEVDEIIENDVEINKEIILKAFSFDYKSILRISQSSSFTKFALQLFILGGIINSLSIQINANIFSINDVPSGFFGFLFFYFSYTLILFSFIYMLEYTLKNMEISGLSLVSSMRVSGFLSIILLLRATLSLIYNFYLYGLVGIRGSDGEEYFYIFEGISWTISGLLLAAYLISYISLRAKIDKLFTFVLLLTTLIFTNILFGTIIVNIIYVISQIPYVNAILSLLVISAPFGLQFLYNK